MMPREQEAWSKTGSEPLKRQSAGTRWLQTLADRLWLQIIHLFSTLETTSQLNFITQDQTRCSFIWNQSLPANHLGWHGVLNEITLKAVWEEAADINNKKTLFEFLEAAAGITAYTRLDSSSPPNVSVLATWPEEARTFPTTSCTVKPDCTCWSSLSPFPFPRSFTLPLHSSLLQSPSSPIHPLIPVTDIERDHTCPTLSSFLSRSRIRL